MWKLREVRPGVPLLNMQMQKVGGAFAALRRKSKGSTDYSYARLPIAKTFENRVI